MENLLLTNSKHFFNKTVLVHILFLVVLYGGIDFYIIDYSSDENAFSKGFYSKLVICILYFIGSKNGLTLNENHKPIDAAFHFSVFWLCLWLGISSLLLDYVAISRYAGIFILFGGLSAFNLIDEILKISAQKKVKKTSMLVLTESFLKILLFAIFCLAVFFFIFGEWSWDVRPFYEW